MIKGASISKLAGLIL
jgi:hypothetical protein